MAVIETKIDSVIEIQKLQREENKEEHKDIKKVLESKADKWVEDKVKNIDKILLRIFYSVISILVSIIGFFIYHGGQAIGWW